MGKAKAKDSIRNKAVDQIITGWDECADQFYAAIKANDKQRGQVVFAINIDKSDTPPSVVTKISFKDVDTEGDLKVNKTFSKIIGGKADDEDQTTLSLDNDGAAPSEKLKKKKAVAPKKKAAPKAKSKPKAKKEPKEKEPVKDAEPITTTAE